MPNLTFYATDDDWPDVLTAVFDLGVFRVFEAYSEPDREIREFGSPAEIAPGAFLVLFVPGTGPSPAMTRIDLNPGALGDATFRYHCEGWGLIGLYHGRAVGTRELRWSNTNHNTEKRATRWYETEQHLGDPADWDWPAVTSASGRLNRTIRRMAVDRIGSHPVLPDAARFIAAAGLRHERGTGVHAHPSAASDLRTSIRCRHE